MAAEKRSPMTTSDQQMSLLTSLSEEQRALAMERFAVVRLVVEEGLPQAQVAREQHIPLRSLQRWIALYRKRGLIGLARRRNLRAISGVGASSPILTLFPWGWCSPT